MSGDTSKADTDLHWALDTVCHENLNRAKVCGRRQQVMDLRNHRACLLAGCCLPAPISAWRQHHSHYGSSKDEENTRTHLEVSAYIHVHMPYLYMCLRLISNVLICAHMSMRGHTFTAYTWSHCILHSEEVVPKGPLPQFQN